MDREDPITQFFPDEESVDLYAVFSLQPSATTDEIKRSYRRLALLYHPDKHATATESAQAAAGIKFKQIGFAYSVLSDEERRQRYDRTGKTDEGFELAAGDEGWEAYFEELFERVTRDKLDEMKKEYQGSSEEIADLQQAYNQTGGSIEEIMSHIPHSTHYDESRFVAIINDLLTKGDLATLPAWETSTKDGKAKQARKKRGEQEAKEAEAHAQELGIWDEFYGSGKTGARKGKGKGNLEEQADEEEDHAALQALILGKRKKMDGFFDSLAVKYAEPDSTASKSKGGRRGRRGLGANDIDMHESPQKKSKRGIPPPPDIDDGEFEKLQKSLFADRAQMSGGTKTSKSRRTK